MIHRFQEGREKNLVILEDQDHHFAQEYQEDPKK